MSSPEDTSPEERVLVLAPTGRDCSLTVGVLRRQGLFAEACGDVADACSKIERGAAALLVAEEALSPKSLAQLAETLAAQPPWSDLPIAVLTGTGETTRAQVRAIEMLGPTGNVTILERPVRVFTMLLAVHMMLRARKRQYQMRDLHGQMKKQMEALRSERELRARFVSLLAHDLRGPLAAAVLASDSLLSDPPRPERRKELSFRVKRNLMRIEQMVHDLLDATRIQAGVGIQPRLEACNLNTLCREVIDELNEASSNRLRFESTEEIAGVWSPSDLRRSLWNLVTNAIKYGGHDAPITISIQRTPDRVRLSVHNRGTPLSEEDQRRVFEPFARSPSTDMTEIGWGLGLTLVRGCAEAHGGRVLVESSEPAGTTFTIEIPLDSTPYQGRVQVPSKARVTPIDAP